MLGEDHERTTTARRNRDDLATFGKTDPEDYEIDLLAEAEEHPLALQRLMERREIAKNHHDRLGPDHPDTLSARFDIALLLWEADRDEDALREFKRLLPLQLKVLGSQDMETRVTQAVVSDGLETLENPEIDMNLRHLLHGT